MAQDGACIVAGARGPDRPGSAVVLKVSPSGEIAWDRVLDGSIRIDLRGVCALPNGDVVVAGCSLSGDWEQGSLVMRKLDTEGRSVWQKQYSPFQQQVLLSSSMLPLPGGFVVGGLVIGKPGEAFPGLAEFNLNGYLLWGWRDAESAGWCSLALAPPAEAECALLSTSEFYYNDMWNYRNEFTKVDIAGRVLCRQDLGPIGSVKSMAPSFGGGYLITGMDDLPDSPTRGPFLLKIDQSGRPIWRRTLTESAFESVVGGCPLRGGGYIVVGVTASKGGGGKDIYVVRID